MAGESGVNGASEGRRRERPQRPAGRSVAALAVALVFFGGCVRYQARPLAPEQSAAVFESRTLADPDLRRFLSTNLGREFVEWPLARMDLETLTWVAFHFHPSLELARAQWAVAAAGQRTAAGRPNPTASFTPGYNFNAASAVSPWFPGLAFDLPVETMGKRAKRMSRAAWLAEAARWNLTTAAWQVRSALRSAVIDVRAAEARLALLQGQIEAQQGVLALLEARQAAGGASALDVATPRVALARLQAGVADARRVKVESRARLAEAVGLPVRAVETLAVHFPFTPETWPLPATEEAQRAALWGRADVQAALATYEASQANLQVEIARQYPDLHLGSGYQWDQGENKWNLALTLELPILNRNEGPIAEAEARRREAAAQWLALQARVLAGIEQATAGQLATRGQRAEVQRVRDALRDRLQRVEARLAAGSADRLESQLARAEFGASELELLDVDVQVARSAGRLEDALQLPLDAIAAIERGGPGPAKKD